ncbi:MAG: DUF368 domain-containing protein [Bacteroidales bacterium]|nr:DUF368 domain-containing protein [Bacteroidales bacterium]
MKIDYKLILKGIAMGTANVIPGVSGGTIALITGIFERFIFAFKNFNFKALNLLFKGRIKELLIYIDFYFLLQLFIGVFIALFSVAYLLRYLFQHYPIFTWSYFTGLILASVIIVFTEIKKIRIYEILFFIVGIAIALILVFTKPLQENTNVFYLVLCGALSIIGMVVPGLSGSYILLLMGNYKLIMIDSILTLNFKILIPVIVGVAVGFVVISNILAILIKKFRDQTLSIIDGFILGSITLIWPWKYSYDLNYGKLQINKFGEFVDSFGNSINFKPFIVKYEYFLPQLDIFLLISIGIMIIGFFSVWIPERIAKNKLK